jgi:SAM-dependent methyltransferase
MNTNSSPISIDHILGKIREEVLKGSSLDPNTGISFTQQIIPQETFFWTLLRKINMRLKKYWLYDLTAPLIGRFRPLVSSLRYERVLQAKDLIRMGHDDLLKACYLKILGREPDHEGMEYNLLMLRTGRANDLSVISNFINSDEAKKNKFRVKVRGLGFLKLKRLLKQIPVLGYLFTVLSSLILLPKRLEEINFSVSRFSGNLERLDKWRSQASISIGSLEKSASEMSSDMYGIKKRIKSQIERTPRFEKFYFEFEDKFRGPEDEVKKRLERYVHYLKGFNTGDMMLDLGCGRGEWLELLGQNGYKGVGVDESGLMVERARSKGLEIVKQDMLEYLAGQPDGAFSCITGFHIAEHLPFDQLLELVEASHRVLKAGGVLILETPYTGGQSPVMDRFYLDPTHLRPVPPMLLNFLLEHKGMFQCEVLMVNPSDNNDSQTAQDYSVIGFKPK